VDSNERFDVLIRKADYSDKKDVYYLTLFRKLEDIDDLLLHPDIMILMEAKVVRLEKIDSYRFRLFVSK
jgi:hypothetical protein